MKPVLIEIPKKTETSFQVTNYEKPYFHNPVHFHSSLELTLIIQGRGTRITGDHIEYFREGDLILLGSNLPHQWKDYHREKPLFSKAIVVHFKKDCLGADFFQKPESYLIKDLINRSNRGLKITGETKNLVCAKLQLLLTQSAFDRVLTLLHILNLLSKSEETKPLAGVSYRITNKTSEIEKLDKIYAYILDNSSRKIGLSEIASAFNMSRTGFCRYFKSHTQKTFSKFVMELRISNSCQLLNENKLGVSQIAYECGFNQVSFFNREFKKSTGTTPLQYRKLQLGT